MRVTQKDFGRVKSGTATWGEVLAKYLYPEHREHYEKELAEKGWVGETTGQQLSTSVTFNDIPKGYKIEGMYDRWSIAEANMRSIWHYKHVEIVQVLPSLYAVVKR